jgi:hypothetical protein
VAAPIDLHLNGARPQLAILLFYDVERNVSWPPTLCHFVAQNTLPEHFETTFASLRGSGVNQTKETESPSKHNFPKKYLNFLIHIINNNSYLCNKCIKHNFFFYKWEVYTHERSVGENERNVQKKETQRTIAQKQSE